MGATITSITGLQNLTNLENFRADYNSLTSVDISGLTSLNIVDVSDNDLINGEGESSLTSVNLTGCTNITELRLDDSDFLIEDNITGLSNLTSCETLNLIRCGLVGTVDLNTLTSLVNLYISENNITNLVIPDTFAPIELLVAGDNALTQDSVNNIFINLDGSGVTNGEIVIAGGTNPTPSGSGLEAAINLDGKGWVINTNNAPGLEQRNNWYDATDSGSVCNHTAGFNTFYASGSLGVGTQAYAYNWGGIPTADGWYQPNDDIDFTLYYITGGLITETGTCPV